MKKTSRTDIADPSELPSCDHQGRCQGACLQQPAALDLTSFSLRILASLNALLLELDTNLIIRRLFPSAYEHRIFSPDELQGRSICSFLNTTQSETAIRKIECCLKSGQGQYMEICLKRAAQTLWLQVKVCPFTPGSLLFIGSDISAIKKIREELYNRVRFYTYLINNCSDMITVINREGRIIYESPAIETVLGFQPEAVAGVSLQTLIHMDDWQKAQSAINKTPPSRTSPYFEFRRISAQGNWTYLEGLATNLVQDEAIEGIIINARNISERKKFESERQQHLFRDPLTYLANRPRLLDRLAQCRDRSRREPDFQFALILINIDRFKAINKTLGWELADQFLLKVARLLETEFRGADTIARIGSDEFGLLLNGFKDGRAPVRAAERTKKKIGRSIEIQGLEIPFSASIGIAYGSGGDKAPEQLIGDAAAAMYQAKADPSADYRIFHSNMHRKTLNLLELENDLRKALEQKEFELHYQPIFDLFSGQVVSLEALIRWRHPTKGLIKPDRFIPLAEETGLILPLGRWVLEQAASEILTLNGQIRPPCMLSVNLSAKQLSDPALLASVTDILNRTGFPAELLQLEMTETALIKRETDTSKLFARFKESGLKLAIDDFGTGYSSLKYLHDFPFDTLKIDRSFTQSLNGKVNKNEKIIQSIMSLAGNLAMQVIAEGIESPYQLEKMKAMDCLFGQGFYFSRPIPAEGLPPLLAKMQCFPDTILYGNNLKRD